MRKSKSWAPSRGGAACADTPEGREGCCCDADTPGAGDSCAVNDNKLSCSVASIQIERGFTGLTLPIERRHRNAKTKITMHEKAIKSPAYEIADRTADGYLFSSVPTPAKRAKPIKTPISKKRFRRLKRSLIVMCCSSNEKEL